MAAARKRSLGRIPALDGIRGLAIGLVLVGKVSGKFEFAGAAGVTVFFALSGFLITSILLEEWRGSRDISLRAFYARRALRLIPALAALLLLIPIIETAVHDPQIRAYPRQVLPTVFYVRNFWMAWHRSGTILDHTWSLAVEEQFYLVWPLILLTLLQVRRCRNSLGTCIWVLAGAAVLWHLVASSTLDGQRVYYDPDTSAYALFLGCALAAATPPLLTRLSLGATQRTVGYISLFVLVIVAVSVSPLVGNSWTVRNFLDVGIATLATILIWSASQLPLLEVKLLRWLGKVSYALYLWNGVLLNVHPSGHILQGPARLVAVGLSLVAAELSFRLVERPALRFKRRFERAAPARAVSAPMVTVRSDAEPTRLSEAGAV